MSITFASLMFQFSELISADLASILFKKSLDLLDEKIKCDEFRYFEDDRTVWKNNTGTAPPKEILIKKWKEINSSNTQDFEINKIKDNL